MKDKKIHYQCKYCNEELKDMISSVNHFCEEMNNEWETVNIRKRLKKLK